MSYSFNKAEFVSALKQWCDGRYSPKVAFPSAKGMGNIAYLYDDAYKELIDQGYQIMEFLQSKLGVPVMVFVDPVYRAGTDAATCDDWLNLVS